MQTAGVDLDYYTTRERSPDDPLPWDHIDIGVSRKFLKAEYARAFVGETLPDCRFGVCQGCGVCDFQTIAPKIHGPAALPATSPVGIGDRHPLPDARYEIFYKKSGPARFFGHLEMMNLFIRAIRRAALKIRFSGGFHPKPKISFHNPLPVGMQSEEESFYITFRQAVDADGLPATLNRQLPEGLVVTAARGVADSQTPDIPQTEDFRVHGRDLEFDAGRISSFLKAEFWPLPRTSKKGKKTELNLREAVVCLTQQSPRDLWMRLAPLGPVSVRPADVLQAVFAFSEAQVRMLDIIKEGLSEKTRGNSSEEIREPAS